MNPEKKAKIFEYFHYLLCLINTYSENQRDIKNIDEILRNYSEKMLKISSENKLPEIDIKFSTLIYDIDSMIITKVGFDNLIFEYKDFIESFQN